MLKADGEDRISSFTNPNESLGYNTLDPVYTRTKDRTVELPHINPGHARRTCAPSSTITRRNKNKGREHSKTMMSNVIRTLVIAEIRMDVT